MNQHQSSDSSVLLAELEQKDRLIEQLSEELMRYVQQPTIAANSATAETAAVLENAIETNGRLLLATGDRTERDLQELTARNQELAGLLRELPEIYQDKFATRLKPIEAKLERLQAENQKLRAEVKSLHYRLAVRSNVAAAAIAPTNLPNFANHDTGSISSFGNV